MEVASFKLHQSTNKRCYNYILLTSSSLVEIGLSFDEEDFKVNEMASSLNF